jgi:hypothetical protein
MTKLILPRQAKDKQKQNPSCSLYTGSSLRSEFNLLLRRFYIIYMVISTTRSYLPLSDYLLLRNRIGNISAWQEYQRIFKKELSALLRGRGTHPSIIQWDIFNEGAGTQFNRTVDHAPWFAEVEALVRSAR